MSSKKENSSEEYELPPLVCFGYHKDYHSDQMCIADNGTEAKKLYPEEFYAKGVVYSERPVKSRVEFEVEVISHGAPWSGNLKLGIMLHKSNKKLDRLKIPRYTPECHNHCVWSTKKLHNNVTTMTETAYGKVSLDDLEEGDRLGIIITSEGVLHFLVNGEPQGIATHDIYREGHDVYVVVDHYANCKATRITRAITREIQKANCYQELQQTKLELQQTKREIQEKNRELQEKDRELQKSRDAVHIYQQQVLTDDHWVIDKDEVTVTGVELGRGSYATVNVGIFRGLRVAVKSLHTIIISDYNLALFSREMSIASRVRHPNLVQFIGATKVSNPLILTELMSTSLHKELQKI
ncbi:PREDICTED: uncharacterized protein LOC109584371 [Amphimedon queenslandica]|uniref:Protein kinase domain-containing protein n=1 Tax=Amphimedon queenslandica TaxID=400682 RepID=A0AAN0JF32_AMPQE|nr:PREDICTED: uncharacterized protein LOC109584371 [Amphimedon queenslandica]|eukprot:XP_019855645.1 PREDICTED: uncharacterized protein LOC109584371 [Amphimedon queenslandica]